MIAAQQQLDFLEAAELQLSRQQDYVLGYPMSRFPIDWSPLDTLHRRHINEVGDPWENLDAGYPQHVKRIEQAVLCRVAGWFQAPDPFWGYMANGSSEAVGQGMRQAKALHPTGVLYYSRDAHDCVRTWGRDLELQSVVVDSDDAGAIDLQDLSRKLIPGRPALFVLTAGTTMREAIDDVPGVHDVLDSRDIPARYIHLDAAMTGVPLGVTPEWKHIIRFGPRGAQSGNISGHKFPGCPNASGAFVGNRDHARALRREVEYLGTSLATPTCSRPGHAVLEWAHVLDTYADDELSVIAEISRIQAANLYQELIQAGIPAMRNHTGYTVWFPTPDTWIVRKYGLAVSKGTAHVVCVPGTLDRVLNEFAADMKGQA